MTDQDPINSLVVRGAGLGETTELATEILRQQASLANGMRLVLESGEAFTEPQIASVQQLIGSIETVQAQVADQCEATATFLRRGISELAPDVQLEQLREWKLVAETQVAGIELAIELHLLRDAWARINSS